MKRAPLVLILALVAALAFAASAPKRAVKFDPKLPALGTKFHALPDDKGRELVEKSCYTCHSADILVQQRLTEKQWTATVEKMMRWGAKVDEKQKPDVIAYLTKHFGPDNNKFTPEKTRPVGY
jgi:cytochrome c5